jgi:isocitrate/isopropylmalate dehydrogenase
MSRRYVVVCLAASGTSPELMAEASLALHRVSRLHGFEIEERHAPFGADAFVRLGTAVPAATRTALLLADAVLVSSASDPALPDVEAELDLRARLTRVRFGASGELAVVSPLDGDSAEWAVARGFTLAAERSLRLCVVEDGAAWNELVAQEAARREDVAVERLRPRAAVRAVYFEPDRFDVVLARATYAYALAELAAFGRERVVADALLAGHGPGLFLPARDGSPASAGQGVVDPSSMLLAASLLLGDGLGERGAAATLAGAVASAPIGSRRTTLRRTTRELTESVVGGFQLAHRNAEFWEAPV